MKPFEKWSLWVTTALTGGTGLAYWYVRYFMEPTEPWSVINHPIQPWLLKAHIVVAPLLVFAVGLVTVGHIWRHFRTGVQWGRKSGLTAMLALAPMVFTGYAIQVITHQGWVTAMAWSHIGFGVLYLLGFVLHARVFRGPPPPNGKKSKDAVGKGRSGRSSSAGAGAATVLSVLAVLLPSALPASSAADTTRTYYVAAEEVLWDYAPAGGDVTMGRPFDSADSLFVAPGPARIGSEYRKAVYREYIDSTFETPKPVPREWIHKGILGPVLRAEVGDTIRVVFRNNASRPYTIHPHGVFYDKASEGVPTNDGTRGAERADDRVEPGGTHVYVWPVPERAGPGPSDPSSMVWLYHSHVDEPRDTNTGLIGTMVVTRRGMADAAGRPVDVDREFVTLFKIFDENASWYLEENVARYAGRPGEVDRSDPDFEESNLMHAINGLVFGSLALLTMEEGERVRWYIVDLGSEVDLHTAHWHGATAIVRGARTDVVELMPGSMKVADMVADNPGIWMYHCHVDDHIEAGMTGRFRIVSRRRTEGG